MRRFAVIAIAATLLVAALSPGIVAAGSESGHQLRASIEMGYKNKSACPAFPTEVTPPSDLQLGNCWEGTIEGDLEGSVNFWERPQIFLPSLAELRLERFFEVFLFRLDGGEWIYGTDFGVWNMSTGKYRAQGWVTAASAGMQHLVGWHYFYAGSTVTAKGYDFWTDDAIVRMNKAKGA